MPKLAYPLTDLFDEIGMSESVRVLEEARHLEPLASRFLEWWEENPRRRNSRAAARAVQEMNLDTKLFKNMLVRWFQHQQKCLAQIRQAQRVPEITSVSLDAAAELKNSEERIPHLQTAGVLEKDRPQVAVQTNIVNPQMPQLPSFESEMMQLEERLRGQLPAAQVVEGEVVSQ